MFDVSADPLEMPSPPAEGQLEGLSLGETSKGEGRWRIELSMDMARAVGKQNPGLISHKSCLPGGGTQRDWCGEQGSCDGRSDGNVRGIGVEGRDPVIEVMEM